MPAPLAVPMVLDALVVNQSVLARDTFRWWQFNYQALSHFKSPEPMALDRAVGGQQAGVYLSWTLPDALRHAPAEGSGEYPLVPNRWLIVRMNGTAQRKATAWVLESDCPLTSAVTTTKAAATSLYLPAAAVLARWQASADPIRRASTLSPTANTVQVARLGVSFPLAGWTERAPSEMFLTAVAPANPLFSSYLAHNLGVFSWYDDLTGIDSGTLSYFVLGWYSDPAQDVLAPGGNDERAYTALLAELGWSLAGGSTGPTGTSVYHGAAFAIDWERKGSVPAADPLQAIRDSGKLNVGVGNTTIDAFTTLIAPQLSDPAQAELLRAFQYDFLQQLNEINGTALLEEKVRQAWFGSKAGGHSWTIVANSSDGSPGTVLTEAEQTWLNGLNTAQQTLDAALTELYSRQWQVHSLWLRNGYLADSANVFPVPPSGVGDLAGFQQRLGTELDPNRAGSAAAGLVAQFAVVQRLLAQVPQPDWTGTDNAQQALQNGILNFARDRSLDPAKTLKVRSAPRYWQANNPVVVLSGVRAPSAVSSTDLPVRPGDDLVTGLTAGGKPVGAAAAAGLVTSVGSLTALPYDAVLPLLQEFLLLDPAGTAALATAAGVPAAVLGPVISAHDPASYQGRLPAIPLGPWSQPWSPLFLEWAGTYCYVPFELNGSPAWTFDGTDYRLSAAPSTIPLEQRSVGGISLLGPQAGFVFGARLEKFVQQFGTGTELAQLDQWIENVDGWQFLAQELTGFNQLLSLRDGRAFRRPALADQLGGLPVAALTGYDDGPIPAPLALPAASQGQVNTVPLFPNGAAPNFHGARQGELFFTDFFLYDKFGRVLYAIESGQSSGLYDYTNFPVRIDPALLPDQSLAPKVTSVLQLPPRLLQHARLDFRLLDAQDDSKVYEVDPDVMPISGWVLPNHLDGSILVFAPNGAALGEYRLLVGADGRKSGVWTPPPHSVLTFAEVTAAAPHLAAMLSSARLATEAGFQAFLAAIDATLWTTDPLGSRVDANLSVLVGRPLALIRTRLELQLDGDPIVDTGWAATFDQPAPDFLTSQFSIRLGDRLTRQDGVMGYYSGSDYDTFNSTAAPDPGSGQDYLQVIGPVGSIAAGTNYPKLSFAAGDYCYLTVLADPRAAMHAFTGILPVKQCDIPQPFVEAALAAMQISFSLGPLLTTVGSSPGPAGTPPEFPNSIVYPIAAQQNGNWSWWEPDPVTAGWTGYGLVQASPDATSTITGASLREGYLQFITDLTSTT